MKTRDRVETWRATTDVWPAASARGADGRWLVQHRHCAARERTKDSGGGGWAPALYVVLAVRKLNGL